MSTVDDIIEQTASRGGKSPGEANNSDTFEAFGLFRDYLDIVRGARDSRANLMPIYGDLYQIKL